MYFSSGEIVHIRPSGNADELRIYAVAATEQRADEIAALGIAEPNGFLRQMEQAVTRSHSLTASASDVIGSRVGTNSCAK